MSKHPAARNSQRPSQSAARALSGDAAPGAQASREIHAADPIESEAAEVVSLDSLIPDDGGVSLDELSAAYAQLMTKGEDPYEPAPAPSEPAASGPWGEMPEEDTDTPGDSDQACEVSPRSILEAMLFVGHPFNEPLTSKQVSSLMRGVRPDEIDALVVELNAIYQQAGAAYTIVAAGAGYRLELRPDLMPVRDRFYGRIKEARLSQAAVDVLAIVAYHQPVSAEEVDALRGKPSGAILSQLVRRQLLRISRPDVKPRKPIYETSDRFLETFGLDRIEDLPRSEELGAP